MKFIAAARTLLIGAVCLFSPQSSALPEDPRLEYVFPPNDTVVSANTRVWVVGTSMAQNGSAAVCDSPTDDDSEPCTGVRLQTFEDSRCRVQSPTANFSSTNLSATADLTDLRISVTYQPLGAEPNTVFRSYTVADFDDSLPPTAPTDVRVDLETPFYDGGGGSERPTIRARWSPASDDFGVAYYRLERVIEGQPRAFACVPSRGELDEYSFFDVREPGEVFEFQVRAIDYAGNVGPASRLFIAATPGSTCSCSQLPSGHSALVLLSSFFLLGAVASRNPRAKKRHLTFC